MTEGSVDSPVTSLRVRAIRRIAAAIGWLTAAFATWVVVLGLELVYAPGDGGVSLEGRLGYLIDQSLRLTLAASVPLAALHAGRLALARAGRWHKPLMALVVLAVIARPVWDQASFLTSGGAVSEWTWVRELQFVLFGVLAAAHYAAWRWHVVGLTAPAPERAQRSGLAAFVAGYAWSLGGTIVLVALVYVLSFELKAYAYFARFLVIPTWLVAGTLVYRTCGGPMRRLWPAVICTVLLLGASQVSRVVAPDEVASARADHLRRGKLVALNDVLIRPGANAFTSFDLGAAERYDCGLFERNAAPEPLPLEPESRKNVLIISIDALRRDALSWLEDGRPVMPQLRSFAAQSLDYERAVTTYPATLLAMGGALTGLGASQLLFAPAVPDNVFTLTRSRFKTRFAALPKSGWFRKKIVERLLLQGIEREYFPDANAQTAWFIRRLKRAKREGGEVFGWIHYYEPHQRYLTHENFDFGDTPRQRYMSEVAYVDHHLGRLLRFLTRNHWYEDTLVIVLADHGQALGERDYWGHHVYLNSWITDIPLLVRGPGIRPGKDEHLVDITDVAPTVMHFAGLPPPPRAAGRSLLAPPPASERYSIAEAFPVRGEALFRMTGRRVQSLAALQKRMERIRHESRSYVPKVSVVTATHRLVLDRITGHEELYDRVADPEEYRDLSRAGGPVLTTMRRELERWSALSAAEIYCRVSQAEWERRKPSAAR